MECGEGGLGEVGRKRGSWGLGGRGIEGIRDRGGGRGSWGGGREGEVRFRRVLSNRKYPNGDYGGGRRSFGKDAVWSGGLTVFARLYDCRSIWII